MEQGQERSVRRFGILAIVLGGHVLLVMLFSSSKPADPRRSEPGSAPREVMVLLDLESRPEEEPPAKRTPESAPSSASARRSRVDRPREASRNESAESPESSAIDAPDDPEGIPKIDWQREREITANSMAPKLLKEQQRKCAEAARTGAATPPGCKKRSYETDWEPEPKRAGMQGLIPFVRIGKRCVVGLGFFGCAIGKLPEADGTLFKDMRDPNRPRSSVPELEDAYGTAELPDSFEE
jgi:hypothetical protein